MVVEAKSLIRRRRLYDAHSLQSDLQKNNIIGFLKLWSRQLFKGRAMNTVISREMLRLQASHQCRFCSERCRHLWPEGKESTTMYSSGLTVVDIPRYNVPTSLVTASCLTSYVSQRMVIGVCTISINDRFCSGSRNIFILFDSIISAALSGPCRGISGRR